MSQTRKPRLKSGDVVRLEDPDYKYGSGTLLLQVTAIGGIRRDPDGIWLNLRGQQLRSDGNDSGLGERYALVRMAAIRIQPPQEPDP